MISSLYVNVHSSSCDLQWISSLCVIVHSSSSRTQLMAVQAAKKCVTFLCPATVSVVNHMDLPDSLLFSVIQLNLEKIKCFWRKIKNRLNILCVFLKLSKSNKLVNNKNDPEKDMNLEGFVAALSVTEPNIV